MIRLRSMQCLAMMVTVAFGANLFASDIENAADSFQYNDVQVVPIDFKKVTINYDVDYQSQRAVGVATIEFDASHSGYPMFDMVPRIKTAKLNGVALQTSDLAEIRDPDSVTRFRILKRSISAKTMNVLELSFDLTSEFDFLSSGRVRAGFFMTDLQQGGRGYFEQYGPAGFEWDHYQMDINIKIQGSNTAHKIYANGDVNEVATNEWQISFPEYYVTSAFFFHLTETGRFREKSMIYEGIEKNFPLTVYSTSSSTTSSAFSRTQTVLAELEATYGAWAHNQAVVYVTSSGGGMEYSGATMTSMRALEHEFTHSWFARGVIPADGNAGFIDEAIASWRDNGYPRASSGPSGSPHNLGGFSQYRRHTTMDAYSKGAGLMSEFDKQFEDFEHEGQRGLRGILRALFAEKATKTLTVAYFKVFLENITGADLDRTFDRYVYGRGKDQNGQEVIAAESTGEAAFKNLHPRPYTKAELIKLR